jgi:hypothetical protein
MTRAPRLLDVEPEFALENGAPSMTLTAHLAGPVSKCEAQVPVAVGPIEGAPQWQSTEAVALPADGDETLQLSLPAREFSHTGFVLTASAGLEGGGERDRLRIEVDVLQALTDLCDFFVEQQGEDGVISWAGYIDQRAVRALLVMYDLTGEQKYLDTAIRWGDHEVEQQREDGGYRMGYGITDTGEVCYVADGGEIAIGMVRLLSYVSGERHERYMHSLREYYRYRENFRLEDGTIGVGWVFHDRFTQKGGEGVHEEAIRSDKSFGFVTSCTLAGVSAWQAILDDPEVREMVIHDARWYLDDVSKATSVSGEAAQWAHYFIEDADLRADLEQRMRETLVPFTMEGSGWWYASGGRSAVTLGALAYYHSQIEASPEAMVGILRGVYRMTSRHSPASVYKVMAHDDLDSNEWRYLAYSAVSLAEVLDPLSTMEGIAQ